MSVGGTHRYPLELLVNYWEIQPALYGKHLDGLIRRGVKHIASFVPWQALESDITHSLPRFLQAIAERKLTLSLILTPELGVHYPNSGIPKEFVSAGDTLARQADGSVHAANLPPNFFPLPSLYSPEFKKRYFSFLSKLDSLLADVAKNQSALTDRVNLVLSGSFWKYYRSPKNGAVGDFSNTASLAYRQHLDQYFLQKEYAEGNTLATPLAASRWKERAQEESNRAFFLQQSEEVFRNRTYQQLRRKSVSYCLEESELYTPEADPSLFYSRFLGALAPSEKGGAFSQLSALIDQAHQKVSMGCHERTRSRIHWTRMGSFGGGLGAGLTDSEKQFLILKSLLLMGGEGGGILMDAQDWFSLSQTFRTRAEMLANHLARGDVRSVAQAYFWTPHLWSAAHPLCEEFQSVSRGVGIKVVSSLDAVIQDPHARLIAVDPRTVINREAILKLIAFAQSGRVVALSRSPLFTEAARNELENACFGVRKLDIDLGLSYRLHVVGSGRLVLFDLPATLSTSALKTFAKALFAVAEIETVFEKATEGLELICMQKRLGGLGVFVLNSRSERTSGEITLREEAAISDLGRALAGVSSPSANSSLETRVLPLEVSSLGVVPLSLDFSFAEREESVPSPSLAKPLLTQMDKNGIDLRLV